VVLEPTTTEVSTIDNSTCLTLRYNCYQPSTPYGHHYFKIWFTSHGEHKSSPLQQPVS